MHAESEQHVRPFGLNAPDQLEIGRRDPFEGQIPEAVRPARFEQLDAIEATVATDLFPELMKLLGAVDPEDRGVRSGRANLHEPPIACFGVLDRQGCLCPAAAHHPAPRVRGPDRGASRGFSGEAGRKFGERWREEQVRNLHLQPELGVHPGQHAQGQQRMAAEIEEVRIRLRRGHAEHLCPDPPQRRLDVAVRRSRDLGRSWRRQGRRFGQHRSQCRPIGSAVRGRRQCHEQADTRESLALGQALVEMVRQQACDAVKRAGVVPARGHEGMDHRGAVRAVAGDDGGLLHGPVAQQGRLDRAIGISRP